MTQLIEQNFEQMNHNTFWDTFKKEATKRGAEKNITHIAKLHLQASKEIDGVYFVEFANELIVACHHKKLDTVLQRRDAELSEELVNILLDSAQKSMASDGFITLVPLILEVIDAIIRRKNFWSLEAYLYNQYVIYYLYSNQPQKALESIEKAFDCDIIDERLIDRLQINKGLTLYKLGRYHEAIELYESIEETTLNRVDFKHNLVIFYKELGNFSKSLTLLYELLEMIDRDDLNQRSKTYGNLANLYGVLGRKERQRKYLLLSLRASKNSRDRNYEIVLANYFNLANFYLGQEQFDKGEFWLGVFKKSAKRVQRESDYFFNYALLKIRFFLKRDDFFSAKAIIEKVLPDIDQNSSSAEYLSFLVQFGVCYLGEKDSIKALEIFESAIVLATKSRHNEFIQTIRGYLGICYYLVGKDSQAKENIQIFFEQESFLRRHIDDSLTQFYFSMDRESIYHTIIEILVSKNETKLLFEILQNVKSYAVSFNVSQKIDYHSFVERLEEESLFLDYYIKGDLVFCLVVERGFDAPILVELATTQKEIIKTTKRYLGVLSYAQGIINHNPFLFLKQLSEQILSPLGSYIKRNKRVIISRSSHLNLLPLHIFPYQDGLLFEKIATSYALSSALLFFAESNPKDAMIISSTQKGDKPITKEYFEKEVRYVEGYLKRRYNTTEHQENPSSKKLFFDNQTDIIHLINHGTFSTKDPKKSGMVLKENGEDVFINVEELFSYELKAEFIFMSGCSTGEVYTIKGEEPLGIVSYLHSNGIKSAILSSWKIPSGLETTVNIVRDFYRDWVEDGLCKSEALQRAMMDNRRGNPYEFCGFVLFGE